MTLLQAVIFTSLIYIAMCKESNEKHIRIFAQSFGSIIVSEIGDKTFFVAAIMSMKYNRLAVFIGAAFALVLMTVLSCMFGMVIPELIPKYYTEIIVTIIFYAFALKLLYTWHTMEKEGEEIQEVEQEMQNLDKKLMNLPDGETDQVNDNVQQTFIQVQFQSVLWQAFILTFLGEWGDRSQITTISLASIQDADIVCYGASIGHMLCTAIAVGGGKLLANKISERTVNLVGGVVFLLFGVFHTYELLIMQINNNDEDEMLLEEIECCQNDEDIRNLVDSQCLDIVGTSYQDQLKLAQKQLFRVIKIFKSHLSHCAQTSQMIKQEKKDLNIILSQSAQLHLELDRQKKRVQPLEQELNILRQQIKIYEGNADSLRLLSLDTLKTTEEQMQRTLQQISSIKNVMLTQKLCVICLHNQYNVLFKPCGHVCVCEECSLRVTKCPIDRLRIIKLKKVFLS